MQGRRSEAVRDGTYTMSDSCRETPLERSKLAGLTYYGANECDVLAMLHLMSVNKQRDGHASQTHRAAVMMLSNKRRKEDRSMKDVYLY